MMNHPKLTEIESNLHPLGHSQLNLDYFIDCTKQGRSKEQRMVDRAVDQGLDLDLAHDLDALLDAKHKDARWDSPTRAVHIMAIPPGVLQAAAVTSEAFYDSCATVMASFVPPPFRLVDRVEASRFTVDTWCYPGGTCISPRYFTIEKQVWIDISKSRILMGMKSPGRSVCGLSEPQMHLSGWLMDFDKGRMTVTFDAYWAGWIWGSVAKMMHEQWAMFPMRYSGVWSDCVATAVRRQTSELARAVEATVRVQRMVSKVETLVEQVHGFLSDSRRFLVELRNSSTVVKPQ